MKETVKTSRTAGYLEKIFRALNVKYFNGELEEPIITIQSTPRAYGHVTVAKAWQRGDTTRHELNIGAGTLARPIENVVATTLHECVHLWNLQNGIQDCSRGGAYHNKKFKEAAEARDLKISYDPRVGWSITEPTDALCEFILEQDWQDISMNRIERFHMSRLLGNLFAILHEGRGDVALTCFKDLHLAVLIDGGDFLIAGSEIKRNVGRIFRLAFRFDCGFIGIVEFDFQGIGNLQLFRGYLDGDDADILHLSILDCCGDFSLTGCDCRNGAGLINRSNTLIGRSPRERQLLSRLGNLFMRYR